ncbi:MmgE/PrpD family protein [Variovorax sp. J22R115]|uniref:MmgE/PrpD family protein n=1 Tax=Variovorax sp. J22R115 TaxID=3053509 RepID=UPI0025774169|nr:MmgE/PrpD family protein [Variovorax sp. J22R115]MDM0053573.1 MmgE/PrpD family protein [Variovorax sp. J22R115]
MTTPVSAARLIGEFVSTFRLESPPQQIVEAVGRVLLDTYSVAVAGRTEDAYTLALRYARSGALAAPGRAARDWGSGEVLPVEMAALTNAVAGHVLDYDDVTSPLRGHPSVAMIPALIGLAEAMGADGTEFIAAYVAGFEVICKLARAIAVKHYAQGWHSTSSIGVIGAAVACARLLGLDAQRTTHAVGLAVAQASGCRANFGTHAKSFQAAHSNAAGLRAALLAAEGFDAAEAALDGPFGYMELYAHNEELLPQLQALGQHPLEIVSSGIEVKKYPLCYATHLTLDGVLDLQASHQVTLADVESVHIHASAGALTPLIHLRPQTGLEAKFSMQYAVTAALLDGSVTLSSFTDEAVRRPDAQAFFSRVTTDDKHDGPTFPRWSEIEIALRGGQRLEKRVDVLRGSARAPLTSQELETKVRDCFSWGGAALDVDQVIKGALSLDQVSMRRWLDLAIPKNH